MEAGRKEKGGRDDPQSDDRETASDGKRSTPIRERHKS